MFGRITYELMAVCWPNAPKSPVADYMNALPKTVFSTTLTKADCFAAWEDALMRGIVVLALVLLAGCAREGRPTDDAIGGERSYAPVATEAPAGRYVLEKSHASLIFRVDHLGFSMYTARFKNFSATLDLDPADPELAGLTAKVDTASLETDFPYPEVIDFNAKLLGADWLNAEAYPEMTFAGRRVELTGPDTARITGDFTFRGVTRPVTFEARFNGGYKGFAPYDPQARIGFSAKGTLKRSEFGMTIGVPTLEAPMGVGDTVEFIIEAEFIGPPLPPEESRNQVVQGE